MKTLLIAFGSLTLPVFLTSALCVGTHNSSATGKIDIGQGAAWYAVMNGTVTMVVVSDSKGEATGSSSTTAPGLEVHGYLTAHGQRVAISCISSDGDTGQCAVGGVEYNLVQGHVFMVSQENGKIKVQQLKRPTMKVKPNDDGIRDFVKNDSILSKFVKIQPGK